MNKFKIGDRVKLIEVPELVNRTWYKNNFGKTMTVKNVTHYGASYSVAENPFSWNEMWLTAFAPDRHELHITSDGTTTNAVYKLNGKVEKTAKAVCCPSDTFNFNTGAELAINRVLYGTGYNPREVAFKVPMQNEPKETVTLYCVKDYFNWNKVHWLKKGESYTIDENGTIAGENGAKFSGFGGYNSFDNFKELNPDMGACLIRAEKRPAKVGEWVLITNSNNKTRKNCPLLHDYKIGDLVYLDGKKERPDSAGFVWGVGLSTDEYLVLPDYQPEKVEPEYWNGKVVCVAWSGNLYTVGKVYEVVNGCMKNNNGGKSVLLHSFDEVGNYCHGKFIEYRGEQSC